MPSPVIVSLDVESAEAALDLVHTLGPGADHVKIGLQLLTEAGPAFAREMTRQGRRVFLDLKLHEIPNSVAGAVRAAGKLGASMVTVHASAGSAVLRAAVDAAAAFPQLHVLALTVITSLRDDDLPELGLAPSVDAQVMRLAALAARAGCHGVVASAHEAPRLRTLLAPQALIVCPGVQASGTVGHDQARVTTPADAARAGATHIVMGRAILAAPDPATAYEAALRAFRAACPPAPPTRPAA